MYFVMARGGAETLKIVHKTEDESCITFLLENEDHTLGNALRYMVMKNPAVQFCGYAIPHPSERTIHLRIQIKEGQGSAVNALEKGLQDLRDLFEAVHATFEETVAAYKETMPA
ncbi:DNA-directed RNA polymerases I and III subunit RPAC2-like isoform X2 [Varroa jacobsoni]|uniref:DNA-directed RNA polymerases I and III subunit RPAC2 n=1 Tax=Varroa destructor TaxID=109461 RepID=A0A7M7K0M3_VARDE|nr:DNA-directed RNA polymerases I and III subunit RPAC2-like isoform X2 [Varroa destructor]XP_022701811.1 DNA-directed RNA polymerases I and III subunit RPAC2-like isoform X2 [Varroa jacobsoni]